ncbi:type IX secretion system outer membrane channel protein PorV [Gramella jeungdoensis]|uniref:Type IX secretion system outer membrane channel protein PorV n=1 Tax=Gramella jeungdoensis TaxID=708091 RepID=A0ABT0YZF0_9FLAO|nr:type IX secretion system outer membrane channel protein PorV [Gramella jeungdoensis]MCM8568852.1 type IX secretion system outer membrane channel protein PorV [Gramella jeungdoensis]
MKTNMTTKNIFFGLVTLFSGLIATSQELVRPVITGAPFLQIVPDARAGGMGESGVATLPDAYSQFHNPAKFLYAGESSRGIGLSYIPQFVGYANDMFHANAAYYQMLNERSALSGSLTYFSFGEVQVEEEMGNSIISQGSYRPNEMAVDLSYSLKLNENFGMSVTGRYIRSDIATNQGNDDVQLKTGNAVAADVSGYYTSAPLDQHDNKWTLGFNLKNLGSKLKYADEEGFDYPLPTSLKVGGGYHIAMGRNDMLSFYGEALKFLVPATDDQRNLPDNSAAGGWFSSFGDAPDGFSEEMKEVIFSLGSELNFNDTFTFRTGYITQSREKGFKNHMSLGAGLRYDRFMFDFAYQLPVTSNIMSSQDKVIKFSLSFNLDAPGRNTQTNTVSSL